MLASVGSGLLKKSPNIARPRQRFLPAVLTPRFSISPVCNLFRLRSSIGMLFVIAGEVVVVRGAVEALRQLGTLHLPDHPSSEALVRAQNGRSGFSHEFSSASSSILYSSMYRGSCASISSVTSVCPPSATKDASATTSASHAANDAYPPTIDDVAAINAPATSPSHECICCGLRKSGERYWWSGCA